MKVLVTNIKFNNNEAIEIKLPAIYADSGWLSAPYMRTTAFECLDLTYDMRLMKAEEAHYTTEHNQIQPFDLDISDAAYDEYIDIVATPLVKSSCVVYVSPDSLEDFDNDLELAVYNQLTMQLQVDFLIEYARGGEQA